MYRWTSPGDENGEKSGSLGMRGEEGEAR